ncbi:Rab GDP-dissociation inhibitor [Hondaea fermentalgiana]|uniref:Rab GDP dissociation inhibitor n=1 Tax=Hondaea fermentalgiana TaxID=2315210 RepID=A0A2R5G4G2_9STRA|nr:Rab GDP-dissociation inhibitor [Hondaea fermentalgiana]|eukprot:GBG25445.1 Rab GDP-dissociation inhibitor [Hondaea fermentalgiana]
MEGEAAPSADQAANAMANLNVDAGEQEQAGEPTPPKVELNGTSYKPLADGDYDAIVLSTGLKECVLAGLLSVRGMRVLQIDRNAYYGGHCASLNLKELYEKHNKPFDQNAAEQRFGRSRDYCVDMVPKLLMANGKLVKMLIQTDVTRYMDFNGIAGSYVFNSGKVYKLPVTPTEALTSSLVSLFQKNALRKFAEFVRTYKCPKRVADTLSKEEFRAALVQYFETHNPTKVSEVDALIERFDTKRETLVGAMEKKYGLPVFPESTDVEVGPGPVGIVVKTRTVKKGVAPEQGGPIKTVVSVEAFQGDANNQAGPVQASNRVAVGDILSHINGTSMLGKTDEDVKEAIRSAARPLKITFMKPAFDPSTQKYDLLNMTMRELYAKFGLDETTQNFLGHAMALQTDDSYLDKPAEPTVLACQLYGRSVGRYGQDSPYLYPNYGLSSLPEGFSRLSAIYGGTVMLRHDVDEIIMDPSTGEAVGVRVGDCAAKAKIIIGDASYFPPQMSRKTGSVVRSVCLLKKPIKSTVGDSCQVILPAKHLLNKKQDVYLSELGASLHVCPRGVNVAIASTTVETNEPVAELRQAFDLMGDIAERFDSVTDTFAPVDDGTKTKCFIVSSLDATSHFMSAAEDIERIYRAIFGKQLNLDEKLVESQQ